MNCLNYSFVYEHLKHVNISFYMSIRNLKCVCIYIHLSI